MGREGQLYLSRKEIPEAGKRTGDRAGVGNGDQLLVTSGSASGSIQRPANDRRPAHKISLKDAPSAMEQLASSWGSK